MDKLYIDDQEAQRLYNLKLSDKEIVEITGNHYKSIARWRRNLGLKSNVAQGKRGPGKKERFKMPAKKDLDENLLTQLYMDGRTDREIAIVAKCTYSHICDWRTSRELPPNGGLFGWQRGLRKKEYEKIPEKYRRPL